VASRVRPNSLRIIALPWVSSILGVPGMMIDSVKVAIDVDWSEPLYGGQVIGTKFDENGLEVREYGVLKHAGFEGSWSSNLLLRCVDGCVLELYGSPSKWLQGHNLWGGCDLRAILRRVLDCLYAGPLAGRPPVSAFALESARVLRIDVNEMFELGSLDDVKLYMAVAAARSSLSHRGKGALAEDGCTLSWGMHKGNRSLWKAKFYAKGPESRVKRKGRTSLPGRLVEDPMVMDWVDRQLRLEFELHARELRTRGLDTVGKWDEKTVRSVFDGLVGKFFWGDDPVSISEKVEGVKPGVVVVYDAWLAGRDLSSLYSRAQLYRHRTACKQAFGVDILLPPPAAPSNVVALSFKRVLDLRPADPGQVQLRVERLLAA
jgi:hypothetical protein